MLNWVFEGIIFVSLESQHAMLNKVIHFKFREFNFVGVMFFEVSKNSTFKNYLPYGIDLNF